MDRGASFESLRDIYLHCVYVLDIYNHVLQGETSLLEINFDDFNSIGKVYEYLEQVESKFNDYLTSINPDELSRKIERKYGDGSTITATVEDYLIHIFQEETHHRGELIALLWQMDVNPSHMGWTQYLNKV
jgi:uncharacterized damage-inducible protein DinB